MICFSLFCVTTGLLGLVLLLFVSYWFKSRRDHYWKNKNVPSDPPVPFLGNYLGLFRGTNFFHLDQMRYKKFGRLFGGYEGFMPILFVGEPELLRQIMVKDFNCFSERRDFSSGDEVFKRMITFLRGEDWKRVRSVVTPAFSTGKLKKMVSLILESVEGFDKCFLEASDSGEDTNVKKFFRSMTLDVIASAAFGTKLDSSNNPDNIFAQNASKLSAQNYPWRALLINMLPKLALLLKVKIWDPEVSKFFVDTAKTVIAMRRARDTVRHDFLQHLIEAQKRSQDGQLTINQEEEEEQALPGGEAEGFSNSLFQQYMKNKSITEEEFLSQCVSFLVAGSNGPSITLSMATYYLALNPECQDKLIEEVDKIWEKYPNLGYDAVKEAKYIDNVISETLRLAPPGVRLQREAQKDYKLADTGIVIPKGMNVIFPVYAMHHDPELFPDPERFDPDRFLPENQDQIRAYSYLPFGSGPRHCIGMRLVLIEMKIALLSLFRKFKFQPCAKTSIPIKIFKGAYEFQPADVTLKVVKR